MIDDITIENYEEKRRELISANSNLLGVVLRDKEKSADEYLSKLKKECIEALGGKPNFENPPLFDERITETKLYKFVCKMPKGADLHVHDMALLPAKEMIKLFEDCPDIYINADRISFDIKFSESGAPDGYIGFADALRSGYYDKKEIIKNWTVLGAKDSGKGIWDYFEELFTKHEGINIASFAQRFYEYAFRYYCERRIMHIEIHIMLTFDMDGSVEYLRAMREAYYNIKKEYPFFTLRIIGAGVKADNENIEFTKKCFLNAAYAQEMVQDESSGKKKNFIIGFDLVNEEDTSLPLHTFAPMLLKVKKQFPDMKLYIHGGESLDAGNDNLIDAYLLGVSRVGHGFNLYRFPNLHKKYIDSEICLELCAVSNQVLGYTKDIRNHPATEYLKSGMAIALCSDDPAYMENETLSDDFFSGILAWNIGIAEIKQLCINSILYSGLDQDDKTDALKNLKIMWNDFIDDILENRI